MWMQVYLHESEVSSFVLKKTKKVTQTLLTMYSSTFVLASNEKQVYFDVSNFCRSLSYNS